MVYISVIISSYNRVKYLDSAISSVLNQSLDRKYYEIIVVKNFKDSHIDELIKKNNIKNVYLNEKSLSIKILKGLDIAEGEIISFLDDDDRFSERKLENVYNIFKNNKINYYHNDSIIVDDLDRLIKYRKLGISENLSSISIRKSIIDTNILKMVNRGIDLIMFLFALEYGGILEDNNKLTTYRLHNSVSHIIYNNFSEYRNFELLTLDDTIRDFQNIKYKFKSKQAIEFINAFLSSLIIKKNILLKANYKIPYLKSFIMSRYFSIRFRLEYILIVILFKINKTLTTKIISKIYEKN